MKIGHLGRIKPTLVGSVAEIDSLRSPAEAGEMGPISPEPREVENFSPPPPGGWITVEGVTPEEFRRR